MKPRSVKRQQLQEQYRVVAAAFKKQHPTCEAQIPGICTHKTTDIHHRRGNQGKQGDSALLLYTPLFLAVCRNCHQWIHAHPQQSYEKAWMIRRNRLLPDDWRDADPVLKARIEGKQQR